MLVQQSFSRYQKSGCAVSTLCGAEIRKRLLQRMKTPIGHQTFDSSDTATITFDRQDQTGQHRNIVKQDGTCAALAEFTTVLGAAKIQILAENLEQRLVWRETDFDWLVVYLQCNVRLLHHV